MKKLLFILLTLGLSACSAVPTQPPAPQPTSIPPTPQVIIATVLVTALPMEAPPTPIPSVTPLPPTQAPTQEVAPTQLQAAPTSAQPDASGPISIPAEFNGPVFANMTVSTDTFSLRCPPKEINFDVTATDIYITRVDFYYRIRDKHSNDVPEWSLGGTLETDGGNHFWLTYSGESVKADNRKYFGWFDFQFVGMNKSGDPIGRTEKIVDLVSYMIDCP